jgi:tripartite-type tricarboxylate transporter receptor subunit TctC
MKQSKRCVLAWLACVLAIVTPPVAWSQEFPDKPVRIVVGYAAGGPLDSVSRALSPRLAEYLKQPVVVENRPGASGVIAGELVARSAPDGYTLILQGITHTLLPALKPDLPFDTARDFTAVGIVGYGPLLIVVPASLPVKTLREFIALTMTQPGKFAYGSAGNGTSLHVAVEMLKRTTHADILHIPYKGSAPAIADLMGGRLQMMMDVVPSALPHVKSGQLKALAVTGKKRLPDLPDVPTMTESGYPEADFVTWWGIFGPAKMPPAVVLKLNAAINFAVGSADVKQRMAGLGGDSASGTPAQFDRIVNDDLARFAAIVQEAGIKSD